MSTTRRFPSILARGPSLPRSRRSRWRLRLVRRAAALIAAVAAALAVLAVARPPAPASIDILVAERDLVAGAVLTAEDVGTARVPVQYAPVGALTGSDGPASVGRQLVGPIVAGESLTAGRFVPRGPMDSLPAGRVAVHLIAADPAGLHLIGPGMTVTLYPADGGEAIARGSVVLGIDPAPAESLADLGAGEGRGLTVAITPENSTTLHLAPRPDAGPARVLIVADPAG